MSPVEIVLLLLVATVLLAVMAKRLKIAYPIVLVLGGLALGLMPRLPRVALDPDLVFELFLPPLLFSAAFFMSWPEFKANLRPILLLALGLVVATTVAVAYVAAATIGLPLAVGFVLGAIVAPTDAIAATSIADRLGLPRRLVVILEGESLINDSSGLVLFKFATAAVMTGAFSMSGALLDFVRLAVGGILLGLAVAWATLKLHRRITDPDILTLLTLLAPFSVYVPAELLGVSGVLATVTAGIYVGWHGPTTYAPSARVRSLAVWSTVIFLLNGLAFILIGLQLPLILEEIAGESAWRLAGAVAAVLGTVMTVRAVWVFAGSFLTRRLCRRLRWHDPVPPWRELTVLSWGGMRGIVSLAAALSLPEVMASGAPFPQRGLVLFLAFSVILGTLVLQGLSLPALIRRLGIAGESSEDEKLEARRLALGAALMRLDQIAADEALPPESLEHLRQRYRHALRVLDERDLDVGDIHTHQRLQRDLLEAERGVLLDLRRHGAISDEIFRSLQRTLDLRATWLE